MVHFGPHTEKRRSGGRPAGRVPTILCPSSVIKTPPGNPPPIVKLATWGTGWKSSGPSIRRRHAPAVGGGPIGGGLAGIGVAGCSMIHDSVIAGKWAWQKPDGHQTQPQLGGGVSIAPPIAPLTLTLRTRVAYRTRPGLVFCPARRPIVGPKMLVAARTPSLNIIRIPKAEPRKRP